MLARLWLVGILAMTMGVVPAVADTVILKSGKQFTTESVWEEDGQYKCIRFGGVVSYSKDKVERIIKDDSGDASTQAATPQTDGQGLEAGKSKHLSKLRKIRHRYAAAPKAPPVFQWDFLSRDLHRYAYQCETQGEYMEKKPSYKPDTVREEATVKADLEIRSRGDHSASFVLKNRIRSSKTWYEDKKEPEVGERQMSPLVLEEMGEDGVLAYPFSFWGIMYKALFTLPPHNLNLREATDIPVQLTYRVGANPAPVNGVMRIKLAKYVNIDGATCAELHTTIDISDMEIPEDAEGKYACSIKGASVFFFDVKRRRFVSGAVALYSESKEEVPETDYNWKTQKMEVKKGKVYKYANKMDQYVTIQAIN